MSHADLIDKYLEGPELLRRAIAGLSAEQLDARPIENKWTIREVVCHIADFEPIYADRMKRVIAEEEPPLQGGDPSLFVARLAYAQRDVAEELELIEVTRRQMARILRAVGPEAFQRKGIHSKAGPLTLEILLQRITGHIPHHIKFIDEKKTALGL